MAKTFKVLEIETPVVQWKHGGTYAACPSEWAGKKVRVHADGSKKAFEAEAKATTSGGAYIKLDKELVGKSVKIRPLAVA